MSLQELVQKHALRLAGLPGAKRALVFSHGFGTDQGTWSALAASFAKDHQLVLYDLAGAGDGTRPFEQHRYLTLRAYARDLVTICRTLRLEEVVAVGHSMGAMISLLASLEAPELFSRLVLISASPRYLDDEGYRGGLTRVELDQVYSAIHADSRAWANGLAPLAMGAPRGSEHAEAFARTLLRIPKDRLLTVTSTVFQSDHRAELRQVSVPTLLVQSTHDIFVPLELGPWLAERIPGAVLTWVEASGHFPHVTSAEAVAARVRSFLEGSLRATAPAPMPGLRETQPATR